MRSWAARRPAGQPWTCIAYFETIVPCGIADEDVTSMRKLLGRSVPLEEVEERIVHHFGDVFDLDMQLPQEA